VEPKLPRDKQHYACREKLRIPYFWCHKRANSSRLVPFVAYTVSTCHTKQRLHCHSSIYALQTNVHFRDCFCDPLQIDFDVCLDVQRRIFHHSCIHKNGTNLLFVSFTTWCIGKLTKFICLYFYTVGLAIGIIMSSVCPSVCL